MAAIGIGAGGLSGLFGVGGGVLLVPALALVGLPQRLAHGTSLAATAPLALAGLAGFGADGQVDWRVAALLFAGSAGGAVAGTAALYRLREDLLRYAFVVLLVVAAGRMLVALPEGGGRPALTIAVALGLVAVGVFAGGVAGLMGVGGGVVLVPAQILLFGVPDVLAKGTSLAVIVPTALVGTRRNLLHGSVRVRDVAIIGAAGAAASFVAARVALGLDPRLSAVLFAALLLVAAGRLLMRRPGPGPAG